MFPSGEIPDGAGWWERRRVYKEAFKYDVETSLEDSGPSVKVSTYLEIFAASF